MNKRLPLLLLGLLLVLAGVLACDSANPIAPNGSVLTVTANPTLMSLNATSTITVTGFKPDGNPLNPGTQVNLQTSIGVLSATIIEIQNGRATTTLRGDGRTGVATVTAMLPGSDVEAMVDVQIGQTDETKPTLTITANPTVVALGGSSEITVVARRADGSLFGAGGRVNLRTSLGTLADDELVTDSNGEAETNLFAGDQPGTATITGSIESSDEVTVDVELGSQSIQPSLSMTASPSRINIDQGATISVIARNSDGSVRANAQVRLQASLGQLVRDNLTTNSDGRAETSLMPDERSGTATITGSVDSSSEVTLDVTILRTQVVVEANPSIVDVTETSTITVLLRDEDNFSLTGNHEIRLTANLGELSPTVVNTTGDGEATSTYTAGDRAGNDEVSAFFGGADSSVGSITIRDAPTNVTLDVDPTQFVPGTTPTSLTLTVRVSNADGEPLGNELVRFETDPSVAFTLIPAAGPTTDQNGVGTATMTITSAAVSGVEEFTVTAFVREISSNVVTITVQGGGG